MCTCHRGRKRVIFRTTLRGVCGNETFRFVGSEVNRHIVERGIIESFCPPLDSNDMDDKGINVFLNSAKVIVNEVAVIA